MTWLLPLKLRSVVKENEKKNLHICAGLLQGSIRREDSDNEYQPGTVF